MTIDSPPRHDPPQAGSSQAPGSWALPTALAVLALFVGLGLGVVLTGDSTQRLASDRQDLSTARAELRELRAAVAMAADERAVLTDQLVAATDARGAAPADDTVVRLVDATATAIAAGDVEGLEALFTKNAVISDLGVPEVTRGGSAIALAYGRSRDVDLRRTSEVVELQGLAIWSYGAGVAVARIEEGRLHELVLAPD
jgi:hypothetical protein